MKKLLLSLTLSASLLVTPALAAEAVTFTDVAADAWYAPYVEACAEDGLMKGAGGGRFDPGGVMTLPEALTLAARIHHRTHGGDGALPPAPEELTVTEGRPWWIDALWYAVENGILEDAALYTPLPQGPATRWDLALLMAAAAGELEPIREAAPDPGLDAEIWLTVLPLYEAGILNGVDGSGAFHPEGTLTRAEAAAMAARIARPELRLTQEVSIPESLEELGLSVLPLLPIGQVTLLDGDASLLYTVEGRVLDWTGALVCDLSAYDQYDFFLADGAARVQKDGLYGYVNQHTGAEVVPCRYREATLLHDGVLLAGSAEEGFTAFDTSGNVLGHLDGSVNCVNTVGSLVQYVDKDTGLYGYLNPDGSVAVEAAYTSVYPFSGGYAAVRDESGLAGFINTEGELVIPCQFAVVSNGFSDEGYAVVGTAGDYSSPLHYNGKLGIVNTGGILVVPQIYDSLGNFYADGLAPFLRWTEEGTPVAGYLTTDGTERFPAQLAGTASLPFPFASGLAIFEENGLYGLMDTQFKTVLPAAFGFCIPSASGSHAIVEADGMLFRVALK